MSQQTINPSQKKIPIAKVNDVIISQYQVEAGLDTLLAPHKDTKGKVRLSQPEQYAARKQVIDNLVMRELLFQEGCGRGIKATEGEISTAMEASIQEHGSELTFKAMLLMAGLTPDEYEASIRKDIIINKLAASVVEGRRKTVTVDDAMAYYNEHRDQMQGAELRKVYHVMIPLDRYASPEEEKKAKERLEKIRASRSAFDKCFEKSSDDIRADDLGYITRGQFHPLLDSIAFRTNQSEISRIVRTEDGLHILLVSSVLEAGETWPFDLIKEELQKKIYEMNSVAMLNEFVDGLKKKARIDIYDKIADSKLEQEKM